MGPRLLSAIALVALAVPAHAQGDAEAGEKDFRQCAACHMIESPDEVIAKGGKVGPNLYGVIGRAAGSEDFAYSDLMLAAGENGLVWDEESFTAYTQDPTAFLREYTGESSGRGKMTYKLRKEEQAANIWAYLASVGPESGS
ncbi:c-type cytochrome [Sulfitobacter sp. D35]|uniref:c-type cytochrome n=1 Tax=Sulfitobacter sp. D35 TaxID=3083252 RepID=UPI002970046B|nr:c-type cytochrome [Sulfitobacter sp. D35]MDW4499409.1 c-type cytochrome [Sulfitobacter sp. D35]